MLGIVGFQAEGLHLSPMDDQEIKDVDRAVSGVVVLHLLDRAGYGGRIGTRSKTWQLGISSTHTTQVPCVPPARRWRSTRGPLCPLLESRVGASGSPVPRPMRLQVHIIEYPPDCPGLIDHDPINDGLTCHVFTRPMGDVQPLRQGLQAGRVRRSGLAGGGQKSCAPMFFRSVGE